MSSTRTALSSGNWTFFSSFSDFVPDANASDVVNFGRLACQRGWRLNSRGWRSRWRTCFHREYIPEHNPYADLHFDFFMSFPGFKAEESRAVGDEFARLAQFMKWMPRTHEYNVYRGQAFRSAFTVHYGADASKLDVWQTLCMEVGIQPAPSSITKCKKALERVHVNIVDLVNCRRSGSPVQRFHSYNELKRYTCEKGKGRVFPRELAKEEGFIKALLKAFLHPE